MESGKKAKIIIWLVVILFIGLYGYYNYLSYNIYQDMQMYTRSKNSTGIELAKKVIIDKYPYSVHYFLVK